MQKVILAQILQFMLQIVCTFACCDDDIFQSTRLGRFDEKYSDTSSETYSSSSSYEDKSIRRHSKKCKCSCDECIKPQKCCIELCSNCIVTQPSIMVPVPYPIPFIVPPPATTTEKPEDKTTKKDTKKTTPKTEPPTKDTPETKPPEETTTTTETTEPSTVIEISTSPPTLLISKPISAKIKCPGHKCIPKSWLRGPKFYIGPRRNLGDERKEIQVTPPARQILEVLPEFADRFLSQVQKLKEIPEDERSIDVQVIDVTPSSSQTERNTYSKDVFRETQNKIETYRRNFDEAKSNPAPYISALESSSLMNSLENLFPMNNKYYHKKRYIMKVRKSRASQPSNYRRNIGRGNVMNKRQYEEVRTFATFPIQKSQKTTESETNNKVNIYVVNVNKKPSQKS